MLILGTIVYCLGAVVARYEDELSEMANQKRVFNLARICTMFKGFVYVLIEFVSVFVILLEYTSSARPVGSYLGFVRASLWLIIVGMVRKINQIETCKLRTQEKVQYRMSHFLGVVPLRRYAYFHQASAVIGR